MHPLSDEMALRDDLIYLNHAAVAPWPRRAAEAVRAFADDNVRQGALGSERWQAVRQRLRERLARLINADSPEDVALLKSTSEALSVVATGLPWRDGDNVVSAYEEFPSNRIVWDALAPRGVELRQARVDTAADPERDLIALMDERTRVLAISSVQYGSGLRLDLERLGTACRERGVLFCVDAIQSLGAIRFDIHRARADFVVADGHKWMLGPEGVALLWCRPDLRDSLELHQFGWHMVEHAEDFERRDWEPARTARRFEAGSSNRLGIHGLEASLAAIEEAGLEAVERAVIDNAARLIARLSAEDGVTLKTPIERERHAGIVTFAREGVDPAGLHRHLRAQGVACALRGGGVRLSPHAYTPAEQLDRAVDLALAYGG